MDASVAEAKAFCATCIPGETVGFDPWNANESLPVVPVELHSHQDGILKKTVDSPFSGSEYAGQAREAVQKIPQETVVVHRKEKPRLAWRRGYTTEPVPTEMQNRIERILARLVAEIFISKHVRISFPAKLNASLEGGMAHG
jgi:hypothetical protein